MKKGTQANNKNTKKSRLSHMTSSTTKNQKQKQKISNIIKNSSLKKTDHQKKYKTYKNKNKTNIQTLSYGTIHPPSSRRKNSTNQKSIRSLGIKQMSKSMPLKQALFKNKQKFLQFPFEAIKFKDRHSLNHMKNTKEINSDNSRQNRNSFCKQNINNINHRQIKTHQNFYIQYDQPEQQSQIFKGFDTQILDNSKKIVNSYNQRLSRYNNQNAFNSKQKKSKSKNTQIVNQHNNAILKVPSNFQNTIFKLFRLIDQDKKGFISVQQVDKNKLPEAALYFLGGVFQKIRDKQLIMTPQDFFTDCAEVYKRSSKQDIDWFINQIQILSQRSNIKTQDQNKIQQQRTNKLHLEQNLILYKNMNSMADKQENKNKRPSELTSLQRNNMLKNNSNYSFSFQDQQSSVISFRKKHNIGSQLDFQQYQIRSSMNQYDTKGYQSSSSYQSAKFNIPNQSAQTLEYQKNTQLMSKQSSLRNTQKQNLQKNCKLQINNSLIQQAKNCKQESKNQNQFRQSQLMSNKMGQIRKNILSNKAQDLRQQIYGRLQRMKINQDLKQESILKQNFVNNQINDSKTHQNSIKLFSNLINQNKIKIDPLLERNKLIKQNNENPPKQRFNATKNTPIYENKIPLKQITSLANSANNMTSFNDKQKKFQSVKNQSLKQNSLSQQKNKIIQKELSYKQKQSITSSNSKKWQSNNKNCQNAYNDIQKLREQFNKHKQIVQKRQKQRDNYFKDQFSKLNTKVSQPIGQSRISQQEQSRIVKIFQNKEFFKQGKQYLAKNNSTDSKYQKNIDRLNSILLNSSANSKVVNPGNSNIYKNSNVTTFNLKDSLNSSCRKSVQISLPLKYDSKRSFSQKKNDQNFSKFTKLDKIDQLSNRISEYLRKNAQKIQVSQNFTGKTGRFNDILA